MGVISSLEFIPSDFKIRYIDPAKKKSLILHKGHSALIGTKSLRVMIAKGRIEIIKVPSSHSTVGWLLKEVAKLYEHLHDAGKLGDGPEQRIVGLKSTDSISSLDYYLTKPKNSLLPVKESTILVVLYARGGEEPGEERPKVGKDSFTYLKVIGSGGYSNVVLARKKDTGKLFAI